MEEDWLRKKLPNELYMGGERIKTRVDQRKGGELWGRGHGSKKRCSIPHIESLKKKKGKGREKRVRPEVVLIGSLPPKNSPGGEVNKRGLKKRESVYAWIVLGVQGRATNKLMFNMRKSQRGA